MEPRKIREGVGGSEKMSVVNPCSSCDVDVGDWRACKGEAEMIEEKDSKNVIERRIGMKIKENVTKKITPPRGYEFVGDTLYLTRKGWNKNWFDTQIDLSIHNTIQNGRLCKVAIKVFKKELLGWARKLATVIESIDKEIEIELIRDFLI